MSAIGDYVHLKGCHYNMTGINRLGEGMGPAFTYASEKNRIMQEMETHHTAMAPQEQTDLKRELSYLFSKPTENTSDTEIQEYRNMIAQKLEEKFQSSTGKINWETGNITSEGVTKVIQDEKQAVLSDISVRGQKEKFLNPIKQRYETICRLASSVKNQENQAKLKTLIKNIENELAHIEETTRYAIHETAGGDYKFKIRKESGEVYKTVDNLVNDVNRALQIVQGTPPISLEKGDLFEYAIDVASGMALGQAQEDIYKSLINQTDKNMSRVTGGERTSVKINMENFTKSFDPSLAHLSYKGSDGTEITLGTSQQKVDVVLKLGDDREAKVSAKNYNLSNGLGVHILSGSSLLYLLQDADSNFVNHYLNLVSAHVDDGSWEVPQERLAQAREQIKMTVLWEALSGDTYGRSEYVADTFIINDDTKTGLDSIQIYDIPTLAETIIKNLDKMANISANGKDLDDITFANAKASSYTVRISELLESVHAQKISVALMPAVFKT